MNKTEKGTHKIRIGFGYFLLVLFLLFLAYSAMTCWVFRDGLGPDAITTNGYEAFSRFLEEFWISIPISAALALVGFWLLPRNKEPNETR